MDDVINQEDVYELLYFQTAINNGRKDQTLHSDILK